MRTPAYIPAASAIPVRIIPPKSPPSTYAIAAAVDGEPGAWWRVLGVTSKRLALIVPGLYLAGLRGPKLVKASLSTTTTITLGLLALYALQGKRGSNGR